MASKVHNQPSSSQQQQNQTVLMRLKINILKIKTKLSAEQVNVTVIVSPQQQKPITISNDQGILPQNSRMQEQSMLKNNAQISAINKTQQQNLTMNMKQTGLFQYHEDLYFQCQSTFQVTIKIQAKDSKGEDNKVLGFSKFPVKNLFKMPNMLHILDIDIIDQEKANNLQLNQIAEMETEILLVSGTVGTLQLFMIEAILERDTQLIGEMDPYVKFTIDGKSYLSSVSQGAGKNPVWNLKIKVPIQSVTSKMKLDVLDEDVTVDDLIGSKQINLFQEKFLIPTKTLQSHPVYIFYEGKPVGKLNLEARFILNQLGE